MATLTRELRRSLENTVRAARRVAESGAHKVIEQLAVHHHEPWPTMTPSQRELRNRLRAHGRQLGDRRDERRGVQAIDRLATECAYEHWHRMLFARFLAETELLIEPQSGVAISLAECEELARAEGRDWLELAADYAQRMLPQIFRSGDPVLEVALPPETRSALEDLMKALPRDVFIADDSLGWVYQYWQADRKEEVNRSAKKIGAEELPAVTQLFTEDYMVLFLLHNTLGAWWAGKVLAANPTLATSAVSESELRAACSVGDVEWTYLRFVREADEPWRPAAGTFDEWPAAAKEITVLDPCMGSGHFLVFALSMLAAMRAEEEHLQPEAAIEAVLRDNLFGLEIDPRCTQIAAFNLALAAWRRIGYRQLPALHMACSGLSLGVTKAEWLKLAERAAQTLSVPPKADLLGTEENLFSDAMRRGFERLYDLFTRAPWLGSLINPRDAGGDLIEHGFAELEAILGSVLAKADTAELSELAVAARGLAKAAEILSATFTLAATNVPYLARNKQDRILQEHCETNYRRSKTDLATVFIERCLEQISAGGTTALVVPRIWTTYTAYYEELRRHLLTNYQFDLMGAVGKNGFETISGEIVDVVLLVVSRRRSEPPHSICVLDACEEPTATEKARAFAGVSSTEIAQGDLLAAPGATIIAHATSTAPLLSKYADCYEGLSRGDADRFDRYFWELPQVDLGRWEVLINSSSCSNVFSGADIVFLWEGGNGALANSESARVQGAAAWHRQGIFVTRTHLRACLTLGRVHAQNGVAIVPRDPANLLPILAFCRSGEYSEAVKRLNQKLIKPTGVMDKVPFDVRKWESVAKDLYAEGFEEPSSDEPTQWYFSGSPARATAPLQVAVARLVGYRWPRQSGAAFAGCGEVPADGLDAHAVDDGIVCLQSQMGEPPASARLATLLRDVYPGEWSASRLSALLAEVGFGGRTLDDWLRDGFFEQHCALFSQRPFVWHIWDGRRDGFNALVNYHKLAGKNGEGKRTLEKLIYTYLGDWIDFQRAEQINGVQGADGRVAASVTLRSELEKILIGEPPYDIFVRWKSLAQQPVGWEPDVEDGVRRNIRPFALASLAASGRAGSVFRIKPRITWDKKADGREAKASKAEFPWLYEWDQVSRDWEGGAEFTGERHNNCHYGSVLKLRAREAERDKLQLAKRTISQ